MYHNILVPISFDDERDMSGPLKLTGLLATPDATITLLHVIEHIPNYAVSYMPRNYLHEARIAIQGRLDEIAATIPNAKGVLIEGHSGRSILDWADAQVSAYMHDRDLPAHPLADQGYLTMGDWHSTRPAVDGLDAEATRFNGEKYECGLHLDSGNSDFQI